jgi:DNA-binding GntR family transcriptional regulator
VTSEREVSKTPRFANYVREMPERGHTTDRVVHVLREAILDGVLPPLSWLRESELAQELSVSRTPVREALRRLSAEGLVTITANQGATVTPMTIEEILEVYVVRENLEGLAARLAAKHRSQLHLDQLACAQRVVERLHQGGRDPLMADVHGGAQVMCLSAQVRALLR